MIVSAPIWVCHPNRMHCSSEHVRKHYKSGAQSDQRRIDGHAFLRCDECNECYLAVFYAGRGAGSRAIAHCYRIHQREFDDWNSPRGVTFELDEEQPTQHLLNLLGYNPHYRPTNPSTNRPTPRP